VSGVRTRAVVFDFDGVLADTEHLHLVAYQEVFRDRGWSLGRDAYFANYLGFDDRGLIREYGREHGFAIDAGEVEEIVLRKTRRYEEMVAAGQVLYPGAREAVQRLGASYRLAIASGALRNEILIILRANDLAAAFPVVVGADDVQRSKPAPDPYAAAVERLGVAPSASVAIEDSPLGLAAARTAGLKTIGITTSYPAAALTAADVVVTSLDEITTSLIDGLLC
jgi:beta-phosphoglucomutase